MANGIQEYLIEQVYFWIYHPLIKTAAFQSWKSFCLISQHSHGAFPQTTFEKASFFEILLDNSKRLQRRGGGLDCSVAIFKLFQANQHWEALSERQATYGPSTVSFFFGGDEVLKLK